VRQRSHLVRVRVRVGVGVGVGVGIGVRVRVRVRVGVGVRARVRVGVGVGVRVSGVERPPRERQKPRSTERETSATWVGFRVGYAWGWG
jgi:hypothetical protein